MACRHFIFKNIFELKKRYRSLLAWKEVYNTVSKIRSFCQKGDPLFEEYEASDFHFLENYIEIPLHRNLSDLLLPLFRFDVLDALRVTDIEIKKLKIDLWAHRIYGHPRCGCYHHSHQCDIERELYFWFRNLVRLERFLPPITNPLWFKNDFLKASVRVEGKIIEGADDATKIIISSSNESSSDAILSRITIPYPFDLVKGRREKLGTTCRWMDILKGNDWKIIFPNDELRESSEKWFIKEVVY